MDVAVLQVQDLAAHKVLAANASKHDEEDYHRFLGMLKPLPVKIRNEPHELARGHGNSLNVRGLALR